MSREKYLNYSKDELIEEIERLLKEIYSLKNPNQVSAIIEEKRDLAADFMEYFKSNIDYYAERWENKEGKAGYTPKCINRFSTDCKNRRYACAGCPIKSFPKLTKEVILDHFKGMVSIGVYPMLLDNKTNFLCFDFDEGNSLQDAQQFCQILKSHNLEFIVEISRSGEGYHVWLFFEEPTPSYLVRKLGTYLISETIEKFNNLSFKSFDRMFPSQDFLPSDGMGNLIALPYQGNCIKDGNSIFLNNDFIPDKNEIKNLHKIHKISKSNIAEIIGNLKCEEKIDIFDENSEIYGNKKLKRVDFNGLIQITISNGIHIPIKYLTKKSQMFLKWISSMPNPKFYELQRLRKRMWQVPRVISCYKEDKNEFILPRGCANRLFNTLDKIGVAYKKINKLNSGHIIDITSKQTLRQDQIDLLNNLLQYDNGIITAPTGFGKTIVAISLICLLKINVLIVVNRVELAKQWIEKLQENVQLNYLGTKKGKIGYLHGNKKYITNNIDVALIGSLNSEKNIELMNQYGLVIFDEVHHASSQTYEKAIERCNARYMYGFTATDTRSDKLEKIIYLSIGDVISSVKDTVSNLIKQSFLKFTSFKCDIKNLPFVAIIDKLIVDVERNQKIIDDISEAYSNHKKILVLSSRVDHVQLLYDALSKTCKNVIIVHGASDKEIKAEFKNNIDKFQNEFILLSTGQFLGEGIDIKKLDTLFILTPFKWKGTLQQYVGRICRDDVNKSSITVYDYIDHNIRMFANMYYSRLRSYKELGFKVTNEKQGVEQCVFNDNEFRLKIMDDIKKANDKVIFSITYAKDLQAIKEMIAEVKTSCKILTNSKYVHDFFKNSVLLSTKDMLNSIVIDHNILWLSERNIFDSNDGKDVYLRIDNETVCNDILRQYHTYEDPSLFTDNNS